MANYTFPGVYILELSSPVHTITAAPTSIAAFVGYTMSGIDNRAQAIFSYGDFQRLYGGLASNSEVSYAVQQFYAIAGSGSQAYVVRTPMHYTSPTAVVYAEVAFGAGQGGSALTFSALSSGQWANGQLLIDVDVIGLNLVTANGGDPFSFNLTITNLTSGSNEYFPLLTLNNNAQNYVVNVVNDIDNGSQLVSVAASLPATLTTANTLPESGVIGAALAPTTVANGPTLLETVNAAIGGSGTSTTASGDFGILMNMPNFTPTSVTAKVFSKGAPIPQTVQGLATQLQTALNSQLAVVAKGAYVTCTTAPGTAAGSFSIRVNATLPNAPDIIVAFAAPGTPLGDASVGLGLSAGQATANVAHYALGSSFRNTATITNYTSTPAAKPDTLPTSTELIGDPGSFTGIYALTKIPAFNLLSIPEAARALPGSPNSPDSTNINGPLIYSAAISLCDQMRAMLLVDPPPNVLTVAGAVDWKSSSIGVVDPNGAAFWPRLRLIDQLSSQMRTFAPSGVVAGVIARADGINRGPWVAAAGISATLNGVQNMTYIMSDAEQGAVESARSQLLQQLSDLRLGVMGRAHARRRRRDGQPMEISSGSAHGAVLGIEPLSGHAMGRVQSQRRTSVGRAQAQHRLLHADLFPAQAHSRAKRRLTRIFVKCDSETTTQTDIDNGVVNVLVGFAPLIPAEFVVIQIQQYAGQSSS